MAEEATVGAKPEPTLHEIHKEQQNPTPRKWAGVFATPQDLEKGIREIRPKIGLDAFPDEKPLVGAGGLYTDHFAAEDAYKMAVKALGKSGQEQPKAVKTETKTEAKPGSLSITKQEASTGDETIDAVLGKAGLNGEELGDQWVKQGSLTTEQYAALKAQGYPRAVVDGFMRGQMADAELSTMRANAAVEAAEAVAGGSAELETLRTWAAQNMDRARLKGLNDQVEKNPSFYPDMIRLIQQEHSKRLGADKSRPLVNGQAAGGTGGGPVKDLKEFQEISSKMDRGLATVEEMRRLAATPWDVMRKWQMQ